MTAADNTNFEQTDKTCVPTNSHKTPGFMVVVKTFCLTCDSVQWIQRGNFVLTA